MSDDRRFTTDRFYGGVSDRLDNLRSMLQYVREDSVSRPQLAAWAIRNTRAGSEEAVNHHLAFLESIGIVKLSDSACELGEYGQRWLNDEDPETLYDALSAGVRGFDILLETLRNGPMTDEEIMDLLVSHFDEMEMTTPGPAKRHREWLQVLGIIERRNGANHITARGERIIMGEPSRKKSRSPTPTYPDPDGLTEGERVTQEEIEEAFDTGFGYRISGINPRRDQQDRRYVLVFANEDGPYDDSVTQGRFEYVGEGLSGDQSETSPGNSTLIDAIGGGIPVHFFYQSESDDKWEYQGLVDVLDYEFVERDGRDVLVFTMEHRNTEMTRDAEDWLDAVRKELAQYQVQHEERVVHLRELYDFSEKRLASKFPENDHVRAKIRQTLQRLRDGEEIDFLDEDGTYRINDLDLDAEINQGVVGADDHLPTTEPDSEPQLTEDEEQFTETRRRARDSGFIESVREAYNQTCVVCGSSREAPDGRPEVEAAHIYPKSEGGADDVRNGVALCRLHHWAFDTGWLAFTDDHEILVKDVPEREGYYQFKQLEGNSLVLPEEGGVEPHPTYLQEHRELHGF
jgi:putative restriction endonuclease